MAIGLRYGIVGTTALTVFAVPADPLAVRTIELVSRSRIVLITGALA
jgi:hypothetical protein